MPVKHECSPRSESELIKLFVARSGVGPNSTPEDVVEAFATNLRRRRKFATGPVLQLDFFLSARNVVDFKLAEPLQCDGYLEPMGCTFHDGFRMVVNDGIPEERARFTIAHELCHTFFYELVSELKFCNHGVDDREEALCNIGAAAFLMPAAGLRRRAANTPVSMAGLESLARDYGVSVPAMFVRLRSLGAWNCELSFWRESIDHTFNLQTLYGGRKLDWQWSDSSIPKAAWDSDRLIAGRTWVEYLDDRHVRFAKPVSYQLMRRGDSLIALWGKLTKPARRMLPLFE